MVTTTTMGYSSSSSYSNFTYTTSRCSLFCFLFLILIISPYFTSLTLSTSRRALILDHLIKSNDAVGFKIGLQHIDSGKNLTKFERLQRAVKRSKHRMMKLNAMTMSTKFTTTTSTPTSSASPSTVDIESSVHAGRGEFIMSLSLGTPPSPLTAIIDTGSDLIWTQCQPCDMCYNQSNNPIFDPTKSSTFTPLTCGTKLCNALPVTECTDDHDVCSYAYQYGDYSSTEGVLATETFSFRSGSGGSGGGSAVSVGKVGFGCGNDNEGTGFNQADGLVGLGRGPLSLVSQLGVSTFAYCLNPLEDKTSVLLIGESTITDTKDKTVITTTSLGQSAAQPTFYYLNLLGISVGGKRLPIKSSTFALNDDGSGGMIIDSGTTITYLEQYAFDVLKREFVREMRKIGVEVVGDDVAAKIGLEVCFELPDGRNGNGIEVPSLVFHFDRGVDLDLPAENYMVGSKSLGVVCLAMGGVGESGGMSILGNVQQFNLMVVYDLGRERLSFVKNQCDKLLV